MISCPENDTVLYHKFKNFKFRILEFFKNSSHNRWKMEKMEKEEKEGSYNQDNSSSNVFCIPRCF